MENFDHKYKDKVKIPFNLLETLYSLSEEFFLSTSGFTQLDLRNPGFPQNNRKEEKREKQVYPVT